VGPSYVPDQLTRNPPALPAWIACEKTLYSPFTTIKAKEIGLPKLGTSLACCFEAPTALRRPRRARDAAQVPVRAVPGHRARRRGHLLAARQRALDAADQARQALPFINLNRGIPGRVTDCMPGCRACAHAAPRAWLQCGVAA